MYVYVYALVPGTVCQAIIPGMMRPSIFSVPVHDVPSDLSLLYPLPRLFFF